MFGRVFPATGGLIAKHDDQYLVVHGDGRRSTIRGPVCADIDDALARSAPTPTLERLASAHPALADLTAWLATPSVPLTVLDVVRLDGFDTLFLELLGRCNERCIHCYADSLPTVTDALDRDTVRSVIREAATLGFQRVQLTGGDPLLCDFLGEAVALVRSSGIPHVEICTNGLALSDELLDELAPMRPTFAFSIYSRDPDEHDRVTRTTGSQRRTLAAIDRVVARGLDLRASIIVVNQQEPLERLIQDLRARDVPEITWTRTFAVGRGVELSDASHARPVDAAIAAGGGHRSTSAAGGDQRRGKLCVTYTGDLVPCIFQRQASLGNVRGTSLLSLLTAPIQRGAPRRLLPGSEEAPRRLQCASCRLTEVGLALARGAT
ncbi:MAG: radical SAM protein [Myxococcales bacterium]|nr:radical SAM protein [Myxococcales bacterium]